MPIMRETAISGNLEGARREDSARAEVEAVAPGGLAEKPALEIRFHLEN